MPHRARRLRDIVVSGGPMVLAAFGTLTVVWLARPALPGDGPVPVLAAALCLSYAAFAVLLLPFGLGRATLCEAAGFLMRPVAALRRPR